MNLEYMRQNVLAHNKVLYAGHAIAGVAAVSPHIAEEALGLIDVEYELLPLVLTAPESMREDAPILVENLETQEFGQPRHGVSNIAQHFQHRLGDLEEGFEQADVIIAIAPRSC